MTGAASNRSSTFRLPARPIDPTSTRPDTSSGRRAANMMATPPP